MKVTIIILAGLLFLGCKKTPPIAPITSVPTLTVNQPAQEFYDLGSYYKFDCIAIDESELAFIKYEIETPKANYNYIDSGIFAIGGNNTFLEDSIFIPRTASLGLYKIKFSAFNKGFIQSNVVEYYFVLEEDSIKTHKPVSTIGDSDSIVMSLFKNSNNFVDSISVFNYTQNKYIGSLSNYGGIKYIGIQGTQTGLEGSVSKLFNLEQTTQNPIGYRIDFENIFNPTGVFVSAYSYASDEAYYVKTGEVTYFDYPFNFSFFNLGSYHPHYDSYGIYYTI